MPSGLQQGCIAQSGSRLQQSKVLRTGVLPVTIPPRFNGELL